MTIGLPSPRSARRDAGEAGERHSRSYEEYHPYGTTAWQAPGLVSVSLKRYKYTGMERDEETGLQRHGVRYYATWLGRWTSADPIGLGDGVNRYCYCHGGPVAASDESGLVDGRERARFVIANTSATSWWYARLDFDQSIQAADALSTVLAGTPSLLSQALQLGTDTPYVQGEFWQGAYDPHPVPVLPLENTKSVGVSPPAYAHTAWGTTQDESLMFGDWRTALNGTLFSADWLARGDEKIAGAWLGGTLLHELVHRGRAKWLSGSHDSLREEGFAWGVQRAFSVDLPGYESTLLPTIKKSVKASGYSVPASEEAYEISRALLIYVQTGVELEGLAGKLGDRKHAEAVLSSFVLGDLYDGPDVSGDIATLEEWSAHVSFESLF